MRQQARRSSTANFRIETSSLRVVGRGASVVAAGMPDIAAVAVGKRIVRIDVDRLRIISDGAFVIAFFTMDIAAIIVSGGTVRIKPDGDVIICERALAVSLVPPSRPAIVVSESVLRIELYCFGVIGDRAIVIALDVPCGAAAVVGYASIAITLADVIDDMRAAGDRAIRISMLHAVIVIVLARGKGRRAYDKDGEGESANAHGCAQSSRRLCPIEPGNGGNWRSRAHSKHQWVQARQTRLRELVYRSFLTSFVAIPRRHRYAVAPYRA